MAGNSGVGRLAELVGSYQPSDMLLAISDEGLVKALECVVCQQETSPTFYGACDKQAHLICQPCQQAYLDFMKEPSKVICPVVVGQDENGQEELCGGEFHPWNPATLVSQVMNLFLEESRFQCASRVYGCPFQGSGFELMEHEQNECKFNELRKCQVDKECSAQFHCISDIQKHSEIRHQDLAQSFSGIVTHNVCLTNGTEGLDLGTRSLFKLFQWAPGKFCHLVVDEIPAHLRIYAVRMEADEKDNEEIPVVITVTSPDVIKGKVRRLLYHGFALHADALQGKVQDDGSYFDVPKSFLRNCGKEQEPGNGKKYISIQFKVGEESENASGELKPKQEPVNQDQAEKPELPVPGNVVDTAAETGGMEKRKGCSKKRGVLRVRPVFNVWDSSSDEEDGAD